VDVGLVVKAKIRNGEKQPKHIRRQWISNGMEI